MLRTVDIFRDLLVPYLVIAIAASCATKSTRDTEGPDSTTKTISSQAEAIPDNETTSPETVEKADKPITDIAATLPAERDLTPVTKPTRKPISITPKSSPETVEKADKPIADRAAPLPAERDLTPVTKPTRKTTSTTPEPTTHAPIEPKSQGLAPAKSTADQLTSPEPPKKSAVIGEQPKVQKKEQKPESSIPKQPRVERESKQVEEEPKRVAPREEVNKIEEAKPEVEIETKTPDTEEASVVAMRPEATIDQPISPKWPDVTSVEPFTMTLESLPMTFGNQWTLDRAPNPITRKNECMLTSKSVNIFDGYEQTEVQLYLTSGAIFAKTKSNIDLSYPETGLRVDSSRLKAFEKVAKLKNAVISSDVDGVLASMVSGQQVVVRLGFWPTWPVTSTREVIFQLEEFPEAIRALRACEKM